MFTAVGSHPCLSNRLKRIALLTLRQEDTHQQSNSAIVTVSRKSFQPQMIEENLPSH